MANKKLNAIITIGGAVAGSLRGAFSDVKSNVDQVGGKIADLTRRQKTLSDTISTFSRMGRDVSKFRDEYADVTKQVERLTNAQENLNDITARREANDAHLGELKGELMGVIGMAASMGVVVKQAMSFENTMAEVKKVVSVDGNQAAQDNYFDTLGTSIQKLTRVLPMTAEQVGDLVAAGGQGGIANEDLLKFAEMAGKMGVAFDVTAEQAGQSMAELKAAFNMPLKQVGLLADKINYLSNVGAASAPDILSIVQRVGPLATVAGAGADEVAALGSTLRGMGVPVEVAGTGIKNFMLALTKGASATKGQKEALAKLGFGAKQVAGSMQKNAQQTMTVILKSIGRLNKAEQTGVLNQLFGSESLGAIAPLLTQLPSLEKAFRDVGDARKYGNSMEKEFAARAATTENALILLNNGFREIGVTVGSVALPVIKDMVQETLPYIHLVGDMAKEHPQATKAIVATVGAVMGLTVAFYASRIAVIAVKGQYLGLASVLGKVRLGFVRATVGARMLGMTMSLTPIGLLVTAVAVGVGLIIKYWDTIKAYSVGMWQGFIENIGPVKDSFAALGDALGPIGKAFKWLGGLVVDVVKWFIDLFKPVNETKEQLDSAGNAGKAFGKKLADGLAIVKAPIEWLIEKLTWIGEKMGPIMDKANAVGNKVGDAAKGGWNSLTGWINRKVNGEDPTAAGAGTGPNVSLTPPAMASRGGTTTISDNSRTEIKVYQQPGENAEALAKRTAELLKKERATAGRSNMADGWAPL